MSTFVGVCFDKSEMCRHNFLEFHSFILKWEDYAKEHTLQIRNVVFKTVP
jgi:hypothetical protein